MFKRSAFIFYEICDSDFHYGCYNIKPKIDDEIKDYLSAVDCWLFHKSKLCSLIRNIKEKKVYEYSVRQAEKSRKVDLFYELRKC